MNKFAKYLVIVALILGVIDLAYRVLCSYVYDHAPSYSKLRDENNYAYNTKQSDLLIIGASRAKYHYNPLLIEDSLKVTCFNAGSSATGAIFNYLTLVKALENGKVKTVIFDISGSQLKEKWNTDRLSGLYPFYWKNDSVRSLVDEIQPFHKRMWLFSSLIQYNSNLYQIVRENIVKSDTEHGFRALPASKQIPKALFKVVESEDGFEPFDYAERIFDRLVQLCKKNNIRLILCYSPTTEYDKSFVKYLSNYTEQKDIEFWDYGRLNTVMTPENFKDATHLNITGANIFTQEVIKRLAQ